MNFIEIRNLIIQYLHMYYSNTSIKLFIKSYFLSHGFNYICWFRIASNWNNRLIKYILFRKSITYGIQIPAGTRIGKGFYIGHFDSIVVSGNAVIGDNCNISQGVTIGVSVRGSKKGVPMIGNNCYMAPGVKNIGKIKIGNNIAIGANAVVTKDIPDNTVVIGVPARAISYDGSSGYITNRV